MIIVFTYILGLISGSLVTMISDLLKECDENDKRMGK